ncbi:MAG: gamma-glutamyltransferase, partial [Bacteroidia bacterium]|nr:gamma-glutamyltransferase [Bacteroidia bacterium]
IAVPGVVAGIFELHKQYGSMPIKELVVHAKDISKAGVVIDPFGEIDMALLQEILRVDPAVRDIFFHNDKIKKQGDTLVYPHLADFLDFLVDEGDRGFYQGEIAQKISKSIYEGGGFLTLNDFESYKTYWSDPMRMPYRNRTLCLPNGPCFGGAILALLDYYGSKDLPLVQVLRKVKEIYEQNKLEETLNAILPELNYTRQGFGLASKGTTHISIVDKQGNAAALTMSLGEGSGYWIPGTDMQLNNMMGETFLLPDGHHSWAPNQRLNSMMTPVLVLDANNKINYVGGSGGAGRIPYVIFQVLEAVFEKGMSLEDATHYSRMHWHDGVLQFEEGADLRGFDMQEEHTEWKKGSLFFGGVHSVLRNTNDELFAEGDSRRFGQGKVLD